MKIKDRFRNALKMGNKPEPKGDAEPSTKGEECEVPTPQESKDETAFFSAAEDSSSCSSICNDSHRRRRVSSAASEASLKSGQDDSDADGMSGEVFDNSEDGENSDGKSNEALAGSISSAKDEGKFENEQGEDRLVENSPNEETLRKNREESGSEGYEKDVNQPIEHDGIYENIPHDISDHHEEYSFVEPVEEMDPIPIGQTIAPEVFFKSYQKYVDSHAPKEVPDQSAEEEEKDEERSEGSYSEGVEDQNDVSAEELESRQGSEDEEVTEKEQKVEEIVDDSHGQGIDEGQVDSSQEEAEFSSCDDESTPPQSPAKIQPGDQKISEQNEAPIEAPQADKIAMDEVQKPCHFSVPERPLIDQSALFVKATSPRTLPYLTVDQTEFEYKEITSKLSSHYENILHEKIEPAEPYDGLEWFTDEPSPQYPSGRLPHSIFDNFDKRRVHRVHACQITDDRPIDLPEPVDYLIAYSDTYSAVGFVKSPINAKRSDVPISIRFGGFWAKNWLGRIYLGCTVRVKQYVLTCKNLHTDLVDFQGGDRDYAVRDLFAAGVPVASTFATEWAVVEQPKIVRSLGIVLEVEVIPRRDSFLDFTATIGDVEYNQKLTASQERWPADLKEPPKVARPVLINWVYVEQPHTLFWSRGSFVVLPPHLSRVLHPAKGVSEDRYVFGWVDLTSEPSRPTIKCNAKKL